MFKILQKTFKTGTVTAQYPYSIDLLGWTVSTGHLVSTMKERLE